MPQDKAAAAPEGVVRSYSLFFRERGIHLGADVSQFAANPPGSQADFNHAQLAKNGVDCF